jgi:methionine synthase II (cobalamin-independent)
LSTPLVTGIGSLPDDEIRDWTKWVLDNLSMPFLPELPRREYGDMTSRAAGLLGEIAMDLQPAGWRLTGGDRPGLDQRRARSLVQQDLDVLEELAEGYEGPLKIQVTGPWTLAATVERPRGDKVLADHGARRDLADALASAVGEHVSEVRRRVGGATVVLQIDEPALPAVMAGAIPTASGWGKHRSVDEPGAIDLLTRVLEAAGEADTVIHCCAARPPIGLFRRAGAAGVAVDLTIADEPTWDAIAEAVEAGTRLFAGVVRTGGPVPRPDQAAEVLTRRWRELGLSPSPLADVVVTPSCGLASTTPPDARARLGVLRETAELVAEAAAV